MVIPERLRDMKGATTLTVFSRGLIAALGSVLTSSEIDADTRKWDAGIESAVENLAKGKEKIRFNFIIIDEYKV